MRSLVALAALALTVLSAAPALAAGAAPVDPDRKVESAALRADEATGRAWVEVTVAKRFLSGKEARARGTTIAVAVPELAYDRSARQIVLRAGDRVVACATLDGKVNDTGACAIDARIEEAIVDTGFGAAKRERLAVAVLPQ